MCEALWLGLTKIKEWVALYLHSISNQISHFSMDLFFWMLYILTLFFFNLSARAMLMLLLESPSPAISSTSTLRIMRSSQMPPPHSHLQMPQKQLGSWYLCIFPCCSFSTMDNKYRNEVDVTPADGRRQCDKRQRNNQQDERPWRDLTSGSSCQSTRPTAP